MEKTSRAKVHKKKEAIAKNQTKAEEIVLIPIDKVIQHEFRRIGLVEETADKLKTEIECLAENMKEQGQLHPIIVRKKGDKFQVCTGGLRVAACKMNEWKHVKAVIRDLSDSEVLELNVAENMCRVDLTSVQREDLVYKLWETGEYDSYVHLGIRIGLTGERVSNLLSAKKIRGKIPGGTNPGLVSTKTLIAIKPLKVHEQRKIVELMEKGLLKPSEISEAVKNISEWSKGAKEAILNGTYPYNKAVVRINDHMKQFSHWKNEIEKRLDNKATFNRQLKSEPPEKKIQLFRAFFKAVKQIEPEMITSLDKAEANWEIQFTKFSTCIFARLLWKLDVITEEQFVEIIKMIGYKEKFIEGVRDDGLMYTIDEKGWEDNPKSLAALPKLELDAGPEAEK